MARSSAKKKTKRVPLSRRRKKKGARRDLSYRLSSGTGEIRLALAMPKKLLLRGFLFGGPWGVAQEIILYDTGPDRIPWLYKSKGDKVKWVNATSHPVVKIYFDQGDPWPFDVPEETIIVHKMSKTYKVDSGATEGKLKYRTDPELKGTAGSGSAGPGEPAVIVDD